MGRPSGLNASRMCRKAECSVRYRPCWKTGFCRGWARARLSHGNRPAPPRRYVARERLCLRGTTDYWVNALNGRPFFVVSRPVDPGLLSVLREDVVPRLLADAPGQPSEEVLAA